MSNLAAMLRLPANLKSTQWQILAGPILILLILSMMVLPLPAFILDLLFYLQYCLVDHGVAGGDVYPAHA
ncbi:hypothetical protein ACP0HM_08550 [Escherichia coli]